MKLTKYFALTLLLLAAVFNTLNAQERETLPLADSAGNIIPAPQHVIDTLNSLRWKIQEIEQERMKLQQQFISLTRDVEFLRTAMDKIMYQHLGRIGKNPDEYGFRRDDAQGYVILPRSLKQNGMEPLEPRQR